MHGCFAEYEALLPVSSIGKALVFGRELFSREFVVQRVVCDALAPLLALHPETSHGLARVHAGHVVVSVDAVVVRGLSWSDFTALCQEKAASKADGTSTSRRVRFRDRKRADLEVEMQKVWPAASLTCVAPERQLLDEAALQTKLHEIHALIWRHELTRAYAALHALPVGCDPLVCLLAVELEVVRVLASHDKLYAKQARRVALRTASWLESLVGLPSLSCSSSLQARVAFAEALFLLALLHLSAEKQLAAATTARRCATLYVDLSKELLMRGEVEEAATLELRVVPNDALQDLQARVRFGLGVLHVGGALALQSTHEWVGSLLHGACNASRGLRYLVNCCRDRSDGSASSLRANWATLALLHSSAAVRLAQRPETGGISDQLVRSINACQRVAIQSHPGALLFFWSRATVGGSVVDEHHLDVLEAEVARVSADDERVHLVRFDVGYQRFVMHDLDRSAVQFIPICKCASAPSKLRGLSSLFLAAGYLLQAPYGSSTGPTVDLDPKLSNSVRLLLRSARRFLALEMEREGDDREAASLHERLGAYLTGDDDYLQLLPWEILYVYGHSSTSNATFLSGSQSGTQQHCQHVNALEQINGMSRDFGQRLGDSRNEEDREAERCLLRAIVLFHMHEMDACHDELQQLWNRLLLDTRELKAARRAAPSVPSYVRPVAWFYQLRLLLERRSTSVASLSIDSMLSDGSGATGYNAQESPQRYAYQYIYGGKLRVLGKLVSRLAHNKVDINGLESHQGGATPTYNN